MKDVQTNSFHIQWNVSYKNHVACMHGYFDQLPGTDPTLFRPTYAAFMLFTARRYALAPVFAVGRCPSFRPSVRPSVCHVRVFVSRRLQISSNIFLDLVAHHSSLWPPCIRICIGTQFQGNPSAGTLNTREVGKVCDFRLKSLFISKTVPDRLIDAMER